MTPAARAELFALRAYPLTSGAHPIPVIITARIGREIEAGAPTDALLLLADQARAVAAHLRLLSAEHLAERFDTLARLVVQITEEPR